MGADGRRGSGACWDIDGQRRCECERLGLGFGVWEDVDVEGDVAGLCIQ